MTPSESIIAMRKQTGLSQSKFAAIFDIPVATLQDWEHGRRTPPSYIPEMMQTILKYAYHSPDASMQALHSKKE